MLIVTVRRSWRRPESVEDQVFVDMSRGDLIFDGFRPTPGAPNSHDEHGLDLLSDKARGITPIVASDLNLEQAALPKDGGMDPAPQAAHSSAVEPNTGLTSKEACNSGPPARTRIRL